MSLGGRYHPPQIDMGVGGSRWVLGEEAGEKVDGPDDPVEHPDRNLRYVPAV